MRMICRSSIAIGLMLTAAFAKDDVDHDAKEEMKKFEGTWQLSSAITDGKETSEETVNKIRVAIKDGKHTVYFGADVVAKEIPFVVDPKANPKTTVDTLPDGKTIKGIYKLDGDTLTSCTAAAGKDRPLEFSSKPGSGYTLRVFKRRDEAQENEKAIEGTWLPTAAELAGTKLPDESLKNWRLTLTRETYVFKTGEGTDQGTLKLDLTKKPQTIDIMGTDGPNKGKTILAICQLTNDTLKVCYDLGGKNRPTEFQTKPQTQLFLVTYKREKP